MTAAGSLAEAADYPQATPWYCGVCAGDTPGLCRCRPIGR